MKTAAEILAERYPSLFTNVECGVTIEVGWVPIICDLADAILKTGKPIVVGQVKEKFGGLRFYYFPYSEETEALVKIAEQRCWVTCELCGEPGSLRPKGWHKVLCEPHKVEWEAR